MWPAIAPLKAVPAPAVFKPAELSFQSFARPPEGKSFRAVAPSRELSWLTARRLGDLCRKYYEDADLFQEVSPGPPGASNDSYLVCHPRVAVRQYVRPSLRGAVLTVGTGLIYAVLGGSAHHRYVDLDLAMDVRSPSGRRVATYTSSCRSGERLVTDRPDQLGPLVSYALTKTLEDVANQISVDNDTLMRALSADMVTRGVVPIADSTMRINVRFPDSIVVRARKIPVAGQVIGVNVEGPLTLSWSINGADCGWVPLTDSTAKSVKEFRFDTPLQEGTNKIVLTVHAKPSGPGTRAELARTELPCLSLWEGRLPEVRRRWAVVIGISDYAQGGKSFRDLQFAHRDAMRFYDFLVGPRGRFASEHVLRLINADATATNVRHALFEFLAKADQDDLVLIYFSGHGVPQPGTDNFFMV